MNWTSKIEGEECSLSFWNGAPTIRCELLDNNEFSSEEKIAEAIRAYKLKLRKDFTNKTVYRVNGYRRSEVIEAVEVTSIIDDKEAWIRGSDGRRQKAQRNGLFTSKAEVAQARLVESESAAAIAAAWAAVKRWEPTK